MGQIESLWLVLYLAGVVEHLRLLVGISAGVGLLTGLLILVAHSGDEYTGSQPIPKKLKGIALAGAIVFAFGFAVFPLIPTKEVIYVYAGGKASVQAIEAVRETGAPDRVSKTLGLIMDRIDRELEEHYDEN